MTRRIICALRCLTGPPQDVDRIASRLHVCRRTVYRLLVDLRATGVPISERRDQPKVRFQIPAAWWKRRT